MDTNQSLDRGLQVLDVIDRSTSPLGVREIARQLDLNPTIIQRLINTFVSHGYIEQVAETRRYRIGYRSLRLGAGSHREDQLTRVAQSCLADLASDPGLNGYLGVLVQDRAVYTLVVPSQQRVVVRVFPGETMSLHATALGKVLLAGLGDARAREILTQQPLSQDTASTIVDPDEILRQLSEVRRLGYASAHEESTPGIIAAGAPVRGADGRIIAAISLAYAIGTQPSLPFEEVAALTKRAASRISHEMGCPVSEQNEWAA